MMGRLVYVDGADLVRWADELVFDVPGQVTQVKEGPVSESEAETEAVGVVTGVGLGRPVFRGHGVRRGAGAVRHGLLHRNQALELDLRSAARLLERDHVAGS